MLGFHGTDKTYADNYAEGHLDQPNRGASELGRGLYIADKLAEWVSIPVFSTFAYHLSRAKVHAVTTAQLYGEAARVCVIYAKSKNTWRSSVNKVRSSFFSPLGVIHKSEQQVWMQQTFHNGIKTIPLICGDMGNDKIRELHEANRAAFAKTKGVEGAFVRFDEYNGGSHQAAFPAATQSYIKAICYPLDDPKLTSFTDLNFADKKTEWSIK